MLDVLGDVMVDSGRQRQVEETVGIGAARQRLDVCVESGEGSFISILPTDVCVSAEEGGQPLCFCVRHLS